MKVGDPVELVFPDGTKQQGTVSWIETDPEKEFAVRFSFGDGDGPKIEIPMGLVAELGLEEDEE